VGRVTAFHLGTLGTSNNPLPVEPWWVEGGQGDGYDRVTVIRDVPLRMADDLLPESCCGLTGAGRGL
jgi:hypothetical protein